MTAQIIPFPKPYMPTLEAANCDYENAEAMLEAASYELCNPDRDRIHASERYRHARERLNEAKEICRIACEHWLISSKGRIS